MLAGDWNLAEAWMELRLADARREVELKRLSREAGGSRPRWLSAQSRQLLWRLGDLLLAMGHRLQEYGIGQPLFLKGQAGRSN